jgi:hypothetical protein
MVSWQVVWATLTDPTQMVIEFIWNLAFELTVTVILYKTFKKKLDKK